MSVAATDKLYRFRYSNKTFIVLLVLEQPLYEIAPRIDLK